MTALVPASRPLKSTQILSVVTVVERTATADGVVLGLRQLRSALVALEMPFEVVVVLNGAVDNVTERLKHLANDVSDLQFYPLQYPVDSATASLAGVESAVGDWVATLDLQTDRPECLTNLFGVMVRDGSDLGLGRASRGSTGRGWVLKLVSRFYHRLFCAIHRFPLRPSNTTLRLMSRAVVNVTLEHDAPLVAWDTLAALQGYQQTVVDVPSAAASRPPLRDLVRARWRVLLGLNAVPLRLANALCGLSALLAALYSLYVMVTYIFRQDVVPGWTTTSLMLSSLFFLMSLVLGLLSEYMILLLDRASRHPRYRTAGEFASRQQNRRDLLNVERDA